NRTQGTCDQASCDFNSYRMGATSFYGPDLTVHTNQKITVVPQFVGSPFTSIRRFYVQNDRVIPHSNSTIPGTTPRVTGNAISDSFCAAQKFAFGDTNTFASKGRMATTSRAASAGMILVLFLLLDETTV
ncbi:glycoside hydrolase, partial [Mycena olivaceomarginata]